MNVTIRLNRLRYFDNILEQNKLMFQVSDENVRKNLKIIRP